MSSWKEAYHISDPMFLWSFPPWTCFVEKSTPSIKCDLLSIHLLLYLIWVRDRNIISKNLNLEYSNFCIGQRSRTSCWFSKSFERTSRGANRSQDLRYNFWIGCASLKMTFLRSRDTCTSVDSHLFSMLNWMINARSWDVSQSKTSG